MIESEIEVDVFLCLFQRDEIFVVDPLFLRRQHHLAQFIERRRFKLLIAKTDLRWWRSRLLILWLCVLCNELRADRSGLLLQRYFFAVDAFDELEIISLKFLTSSDVEA